MHSKWSNHCLGVSNQQSKDKHVKFTALMEAAEIDKRTARWHKRALILTNLSGAWMAFAPLTRLNVLICTGMKSWTHAAVINLRFVWSITTKELYRALWNALMEAAGQPPITIKQSNMKVNVLSTSDVPFQQLINVLQVIVSWQKKIVKITAINWYVQSTCARTCNAYRTHHFAISI